jgi:ABC-2 type transport system permease protein
MVLALEIHRAIRAPRGRGVLAASALATFIACILGGAVTQRHRIGGERDALASRERILAATSTGSRTAFDLAAWQDTLVARGVAPSTPLAAADLIAIPDAAVVRIYQPPSPVPALAERSPAATLLGTLDLVWVLILLLPVGAIACGYDSVSRDRERGTLAMLLIPAKGVVLVVIGRALGLFAILFLGTVPAAFAGTVIASLEVAGTFDAPAILALIVLLSAWCLFLASAVVAVSAIADRSAVSLAVLLTAWLVASVAIPLSMSGLGRLAYPPPDPRAELEGEQAAADVFARPAESIVRAEVERDPRFDPDLAADAATSQARWYFLLSRERYRRALGARHASARAASRRAELASIGSWLSPSSMLAASIADLAGAGPAEPFAFAEAASDYRADLERFVGDRLLANERAFTDGERWPSLARIPPSRAGRGIVASLAFVALAALLIVAASVHLRRGSLEPTKGDG